MEGKGKAMSRMRPFSCLFPLSLRRLEFGARTLGGTRASLKYGLRAPPPILSSQHLDPLPLGNIILSALQKDGERGTKLQPVAFCYGIE